MTSRAKLGPAPVPARVAEIPLTPQRPALVLFGRDAGGRPRAAWFERADTDGATAAAAVMRLRALPLADEAGRGLAAQLARGRVLPSGRALVPFAKRDLYARLVALAGEEAGIGVVEPSRAEQPGALELPGGPAPDEAARAEPADPRADVADQAQGTRAVERSTDVQARGLTGGAATSDATGRPPAPRPGDRSFVGHPQPGDRADIGLGSMVLAHEGPDDGWWEAEVIGINGTTLSLRWCDFPAEPTILRKAGELALLPPGAP